MSRCRWMQSHRRRGSSERAAASLAGNCIRSGRRQYAKPIAKAISIPGKREGRDDRSWLHGHAHDTLFWVRQILRRIPYSLFAVDFLDAAAVDMTNRCFCHHEPWTEDKLAKRIRPNT
nr:hypothetical protein CFP56_41323 [Quercus suber]